MDGVDGMAAVSSRARRRERRRMLRAAAVHVGRTAGAVARIDGCAREARTSDFDSI
ncbi:hypothetical protein BVIET440_100132 [Burkholderia vietnamiensis]